MARHTVLTIPKCYRKFFRKYCILSYLRSFFPSFKIKDKRDDMIAGFKQRYKTGALTKRYLDGAVDWYLTPLYHCEADFSLIPNKEETLALDLGCGAASIGHWLKNNDYKWSYLGIDLVKEVKPFFEPLLSAKFLCKDIEKLEQNDISKAPDIVFAVNSLCYVVDIERFLEKLSNISAYHTKLVIIDGRLGRFWKKKTTAKMYSTEDFGAMLEKHGWKVERIFKLSAYNIMNFSIFTISHAFLCSRA